MINKIFVDISHPSWQSEVVETSLNPWSQKDQIHWRRIITNFNGENIAYAAAEMTFPSHSEDLLFI